MSNGGPEKRNADRKIQILPTKQFRTTKPTFEKNFILSPVKLTQRKAQES